MQVQSLPQSCSGLGVFSRLRQEKLRRRRQKEVEDELKV